MEFYIEKGALKLAELDDETPNDVVVIPDTVKKISNKAFQSIWGMTSVIIPDTVTEIGKEAFEGCSDLISVTIPASVKKICDKAFKNCPKLKAVTIPDSVTEIGYEAFANCSNLRTVTLPDSLENVEPETFAKCKKLDTIIAPSSFTALSYGQVMDTKWYKDQKCDLVIIGAVLIRYKGKADEVTIPDGVKVIGEEAFYECSTLKSVTIPGSVVCIGKSAFENCEKLASVTIADGVKIIGSSAFQFCKKLTALTIPDSVTEIGWWAFDNCSSLSSVTIPDSVTDMGSNVFARCHNLETVNVPPKFTLCTLKQLYFSKWSDDQKDEFVILGAALVKYNGNEENVTIPDGVLKIGHRAFCNGDRSVKTVTIPDSVKEIENGAFEYCRNLISVTIPNSVTKIGAGAFSKCSSLTSVTIPESVTEINGGTFDECTSLKSIIIPDSVTSIYNNAFDRCKSLTSVVLGEGITRCDIKFKGCSSLESITLPKTLKTFKMNEDIIHNSKLFFKTPDGLPSINNSTAMNLVAEFWKRFDPKIIADIYIHKHDDKFMKIYRRYRWEQHINEVGKYIPEVLGSQPDEKLCAAAADFLNLYAQWLERKIAISILDVLRKSDHYETVRSLIESNEEITLKIGIQ